MSENVINYIWKFIKENYSLYFDEIIDANYHKDLVLFLERNNKEIDICNGKVDNIIKNMIDGYIDRNLKHIEYQYNGIYLEVKRMVLAKSNLLSNKINDDILNTVVDKITNNLLINRGKKRAFYLDNLDKNFILHEIEGYSNRFYVSARNRVREVLNNNSVYNNIGLSCKEYFLDNVNSLMIEKYNVFEIINGELDQVIGSKFMYLYNNSKNDVVNYMNDILSNEDYDVEKYYKQVMNYVLDRVFKVGSFEINNLYKGDYDSLIIGFVRSKGKNKENVIYNYIDKVVSKLYLENLSNEAFTSIVGEIYDELTNKYGDNEKVILDEKNKEEIIALFYKKCMIYNSVETEEKPKKIKYEVNYRKISDALYYLLRIAGIAALAIIILYSSYKGIDNYVSKGSAYSEVSEYGDIEYELVYAPDNENVEIMAQRAVEFYNKALSKNTEDANYGYLGFACAYRCMMQDRLYIMDELLREAQIYASENSDIYLIHEQIKNETCFLEFAMHRLEEMGCEKIKKPKYINALNVYKEVMKDKESKPMVIIERKYPEECKLIEEIMEMYRKYNKDMIIDFSNEINIKKAVDGTDVIEYDGTRRNR